MYFHPCWMPPLVREEGQAGGNTGGCRWQWHAVPSIGCCVCSTKSSLLAAKGAVLSIHAAASPNPCNSGISHLDLKRPHVTHERPAVAAALPSPTQARASSNSVHGACGRGRVTLATGRRASGSGGRQRRRRQRRRQGQRRHPGGRPVRVLHCLDRVTRAPCGPLGGGAAPCQAMNPTPCLQAALAHC